MFFTTSNHSETLSCRALSHTKTLVMTTHEQTHVLLEIQMIQPHKPFFSFDGQVFKSVSDYLVALYLQRLLDTHSILLHMQPVRKTSKHIRIMMDYQPKTLGECYTPGERWLQVQHVTISCGNLSNCKIINLVILHAPLKHNISQNNRGFMVTPALLHNLEAPS